MLQDIIGTKKGLFADGVQTVLRGHENRQRRVVLLKGNYLGYVTSFSLDEDTVTKNLDMFKAA